MSQDPTPALLGIPEIAERAGVTRQRIHELYAAGRLPLPDAVVGTRRFWRADVIDRWIAAGRHPSGRL